MSKIAGFVRFARLNRFNVGLQEAMDAQRVAESVGLTNEKRVRTGLKTLLSSEPRDWDRFDEIFDVYWRRGERQQQSHISTGGVGQKDTQTFQSAAGSQSAQYDVVNAAADATQGASDGSIAHQGASNSEALAKINFDQLGSVAELQAMEEVAERLAKTIRRRIVRRCQARRRGRYVDMRRSIRESLRYGGMPFNLRYKSRRRVLPKLIILLDVSRSMSVYSYLFLRFTRGVLGAFSSADAFAFHTRLIHVGELLREPDRQRLIEKLVLISSGWRGGTRIGESLAKFNREYASKVINSRSIVVVISDGYDTGEPETLATELRNIKRRARKLIWLNPLLGVAGYLPETRCMKAALPLIDVFAAANNLESLAALEGPLSGL